MNVHHDLPAATPEEREELARAGTHAGHLAALGFLEEVEVRQSPGARRAPAETLRVAAWNAERGRGLDAAARLLAGTCADVLLLSELDRGMARTSQLHTARELARRLDCGYAFAVEFVELDLGDASEREQHAGETNQLGQHGGAILSPHELVVPEVVRLERSGRWFDGELGERRVGGRIAVLARVALDGVPIAFASVHLESHSDPDERGAEFDVLLDAIDATAGAAAPAVIGGDLNTSSLGLVHRDRSALTAALEQDPDRLSRPVAHEPLFDRARERGYDWQACNRLDRPTHRRRDGGDGVLHLDWLLSRGLVASDAAVVPALSAEGAPLSDHDAVLATFRLR